MKGGENELVQLGDTSQFETHEFSEMVKVAANAVIAAANSFKIDGEDGNVLGPNSLAQVEQSGLYDAFFNDFADNATMQAALRKAVEEQNAQSAANAAALGDEDYSICAQSLVDAPSPEEMQHAAEAQQAVDFCRYIGSIHELCGNFPQYGKEQVYRALYINSGLLGPARKLLEAGFDISKLDPVTRDGAFLPEEDQMLREGIESTRSIENVLRRRNFLNI